MIYTKQPKKIKNLRKKARSEMIERLQLQYPTWFEGKTDKEIKKLITAFKITGMDDEYFPSFCVVYEAKMSQNLNNAT